MKIAKIKYTDLVKKWDGCPIDFEDVPVSPITIVDQENKILFGFNPEPREELEVLQVETDDPSWLSLALHQVGMSCTIECANYNKTSKKNLGLQKDIFLADVRELEDFCSELNSQMNGNDEGLF